VTDATADLVYLDDLAEPRFSREAEQIRDMMAALAADCPLDSDALHARAIADTGLGDFGPDDYRERLDVFLAALHDIDLYLQGINAYFASHGGNSHPYTRTDIYALNAVKDQFVGEGGGDEAVRSEFLSGLTGKLGSRRGLSAFNDLREAYDPEAPASVPPSVVVEGAKKYYYLGGETIRAVVVTRLGATLTEAELIEWCRGRLTRFKCPTSVAFTDALPKGGTGKVQKNVLRERFGQTAQTEC